MLKRVREIGWLCALKKLKHHLLLDKEVKSICALNGAYEYLQRYKLAETELPQTYFAEPAQKVIWTCWLQGIEQAPPIVKKCVQSMEQYRKDYKVEIIDLNNLKQFIELPDYILDKYALGKITHTHFSDIVRLALLEKYGGVWIDSTILLTDYLPEYILNADLFAFRASGMGHVLIATPFMAAKPHHPIIQTTLQQIYNYWKKEDCFVSYSLIHLFFTMAVYSSKLNLSLWDRVPNVSCAQLFYLQPILSKVFDEQKYSLALNLSSIHKLTYKYHLVDLDIEKDGTFYQHILQC